MSPLWLVLLALVGVVGVLYRDRQYWQTEYKTLLLHSRQREEQLFDQLLRRNGAKPLSAPSVVPQRETKSQRDEEEWALYRDRIQERVDAELLTAEQAKYLLTQPETATSEELDAGLWRKPRVAGSEFDAF